MSKELTLEIIMNRANIKDQNLESIKSLNLYGINLTDISLLNKFPSLEILSLSNNKIKDISVLSNLNNLKELYLSNNKIDDINQLEYLKNCQKLEKINLKGNPICNNQIYLEKINYFLPNLLFLDEKSIKSEKNLAAPEPGKYFEQSFKKKKPDGKFMKFRKALNLNDEDSSSNRNNKLPDEERFNTINNTDSLNLNEIKENKKIIGYHKKIVSKSKNLINKEKLNENAYSNYNQFDNEEERKEDSNEKIMNKTFYKGFNFQTYNKKILDKKEDSLMINYNKNDKNKDRNKNIVKSIELLIDMLSVNGLKEVQEEVQKRMNDIKKEKK